jgi:hypothetical protein
MIPATFTSAPSARRSIPFACALVVALATLGSQAADRARPPIVLAATGAYEVGGKVIAKPDDPTQTLSCDHGYVEYFIPVKRRAVGLVMWHSSSTKVWENRWDGGEGYKSMFLRKGYPVFLWDGPRVGRANWSCEPINYKPEYFDQRNFAAWRFGINTRSGIRACSSRPATRRPGTRPRAPATTSSTPWTTRCSRPKPADRRSTAWARWWRSPTRPGAGAPCSPHSRPRAPT